MFIITQGLGGSLLITQGYGSASVVTNNVIIIGYFGIEPRYRASLVGLESTVRAASGIEPTIEASQVGIL